VANISIIIPTLNEARSLLPLLAQLQPWRSKGDEVLIVDGGSIDSMSEATWGLIDALIDSPKGRSTQLNAGARESSNAVFWFLHADSNISGIDRVTFVEQVKNDNFWGFFDARIEDTAFIFRVIESLMSFRSRTSFVATGDQGIFVSRGLFFEVGGYKSIALMEDIELCKTLRKKSVPTYPEGTILTSSRRWRSKGIIRTITLMWFIRLAWVLGISSKVLQRIYEK
jgi:rSAM/selenodomain-associated transferase 2